MSGLGWHTTRTGQVWAMQEPYGAFTWYPVNDHPSDKATYDVRLDVPRRWVGVSNGRMVSRSVSHGRTVTRFTSRDPMASYLATVAIGPYRRYAQTGPHGIPLTYWLPRDKPQYLAPLKATPATLRWLESRLGPYPFDRAGVVVTPSGSAMETQTMITFGADNYRFGSREVQQTVAHELAHAWYGDTVTPDDWSDVWMNEGMAMYVEAAYSTARGWRPADWEREFARNDALWRSSTARRAPSTATSSRRSTSTTARRGCGSGCVRWSAPRSSTSWSAAGRRSTATPCRTGRRSSPG